MRVYDIVSAFLIKVRDTIFSSQSAVNSLMNSSSTVKMFIPTREPVS